MSHPTRLMTSHSNALRARRSAHQRWSLCQVPTLPAGREKGWGQGLGHLADRGSVQSPFRGAGRACGKCAPSEGRLRAGSTSHAHLTVMRDAIRRDSSRPGVYAASPSGAYTQVGASRRWVRFGFPFTRAPRCGAYTQRRCVHSSQIWRLHNRKNFVKTYQATFGTHWQDPTSPPESPHR